MDKTRKPLGVVGMVYQDYDLLRRWYDYYGAQVGAENLFIFSHGNDPDHRRIAPDANVINAPRDPSMFKFDPRRWRMKGDFASGMLNFYNWMLVTDIDEYVVVDPDVADGLVPYLRQKYPDGSQVPSSLSPLGLNMVHVPEHEDLPLVPDETVLSRRRYFYPSRVYSKPTLVREPVMFGPGGHRNNLGRRTLADDLYLIHLKLHDMGSIRERLARQTAALDQAGKTNIEMAGDHGWRTALEDYEKLRANFKLGPVDISLRDIRSRMVDRQTERYKDRYIWGMFDNDTLYQIPERFSGLV